MTHDPHDHPGYQVLLPKVDSLMQDVAVLIEKFGDGERLTRIRATLLDMQDILLRYEREDSDER
jgi:hypothetical protein